MRTDREIYDIVMRRKAEFEAAERVKNRKLAAVGGAAAALVICAAAGFALQRGNIDTSKSDYKNSAAGEENINAITGEYGSADKEESAVPTVTRESGTGIETEEAGPGMTGEETRDSENPGETRTIPPKETDRSFYEEETETTVTPDDGQGGIYREGAFSGGAMIPAPPRVTGAKPGVKATGEKISDKEALEYLELNKVSIASSLSASGVPADNITFSEKGYSHVSYDGTEGKQLEVRENFRDYLVYSGGKLIAIMTVTKENGALSGTPAFGGPWFDDYDKFLRNHKGEKLLYVYAGYMEIIITPDNLCYNPQGKDVTDYLEGVANPYEYFYSDSATYTP